MSEYINKPQITFEPKSSDGRVIDIHNPALFFQWEKVSSGPSLPCFQFFPSEFPPTVFVRVPCRIVLPPPSAGWDTSQWREGPSQGAWQPPQQGGDATWPSSSGTRRTLGWYLWGFGLLPPSDGVSPWVVVTLLRSVQPFTPSSCLPHFFRGILRFPFQKK